MSQFRSLRRRSLILPVCLGLAASSAAGMDGRINRDLGNGSFLESTYLIEFQQGSHLSSIASSLGAGGYELSGGTPVRLGDWYKTRWTDVSIGWLTQVTPDFGLIFGLSTGERASKYTIQPGFKLGFLAQTRLGNQAYLSLRATTVLGGTLHEKSCSADYGQIGGVQEVNCRLAASTLPPAETLRYLLNEKPYNHNQVSLMLTWRF